MPNAHPSPTVQKTTAAARRRVRRRVATMPSSTAHAGAIALNSLTLRDQFAQQLAGLAQLGRQFGFSDTELSGILKTGYKGSWRPQA